MVIEELLNEDGTVYNPPVNPLKEKWEQLYPPIPMAQYSQVCDGYSCMWCGRCPEDREVYEKYLQRRKEYNMAHNPSLYA